MTTITFDPAAFRAQFKLYSSTVLYPDVVLEGVFSEATCILTDETCCPDPTCWTQALNLMVAHLLWLEDAAAQGSGSGSGTGGVLQSASIDKISVAVAAPPFGSSQWKFWLNQSPYGQRLLAILSKMAAGGLYITSQPEQRGFRRFRGRF